MSNIWVFSSVRRMGFKEYVDERRRGKQKLNYSKRNNFNLMQTPWKRNIFEVSSVVSLALLCARKTFQLALLLVWHENCEQCNNAVEVG